MRRNAVSTTRCQQIHVRGFKWGETIHKFWLRFTQFYFPVDKTINDRQSFRGFVYCCIFKLSTHLLKRSIHNKSSFSSKQKMPKNTQTSDLTSQRWFTVRSSLTCAAAKTPASGEQLGFILTTNPTSHNVERYIFFLKIIQEYQKEHKLPQVDNQTVCDVKYCCSNPMDPLWAMITL